MGGGIHGACIAWDAALRGLRVALFERADFGAATSANSLRIVHGGLRYLARGDLPRMRESIRERSTLLRIAPTLIEPLPVLVPTTGHGLRGRPALAAALRLTDLFSPGRNRGLDPAHRLPPGRLVSLEECRGLFPGFPVSGANGGALWYDARLTDPEGMTRAFVAAAVRHGAHARDHCSIERVLHQGGAVRGVVATDRRSNAEIEIPGRTVVIAAGPWTPGLIGAPVATLPHAFAMNVELGRRVSESAVGLRTLTGPEADPVIGGGRFIFLVPQARTTLLGTWYAPAPFPAPAPAGAELEALLDRGTRALLDELRTACPTLSLGPQDVTGRAWGWLPLKRGREPGRPGALADRARVLDHGAGGGTRGMFSVEGVKYTTARRVAEGVVDRVVAALGLPRIACRTAEVRVDDWGPG